MSRPIPTLLAVGLVWAGCVGTPASAIRFADGGVRVRAVSGTLIVRPKGGEPLLGHTETARGIIRFTPQFPLLAGETYVAVFTGADGRQTTLRHTIPIRATAPEVAAVFPSTDRLPANHLKFYIHFSQPMERGDVTRHFQLIDLTRGEPVAEPFRATELWSADGRRLTLWFHPGRQKIGVNLNLDLGPVLEPERRYELKISRHWKSQSGVALNNDFEKSFVTLAADRAQPDVNKWKLTAPQAGTRGALQLFFPEPLDAALLKNLITVETDDGRDLSGTIELSQNETQWNFIPQKNWPAGAFRVRVDWELEDLAGNNLERPFEVNLQAPQPPTFAGPRFLKFEVK